jgi:hypothetical protein
MNLLNEQAQAIWNEAVPLNSNDAGPARSYLERRGIDRSVIGKVRGLKYLLPNRSELDPTKPTRPPRLLAELTNRTDDAVSLLMTAFYLDEELEARIGRRPQVHPAQKGVEIPGSAMRLMESGETLGIVEGLFPALSVIAATGLPTWGLVSLQHLDAFEPPAGVKNIILWGTKDKGKFANQIYRRLRKRLQAKGVKVEIVLPAMRRPTKLASLDWNDVLCMKGPEAFPHRGE